MKRMIPLCLVLCLLLSGCSFVAEPAENSLLPSEEETAAVSATEEAQPSSQSSLTENSAFSAYAPEGTDPAVLALILNEPFENEPEATAVWNNRAYDRLYIIPRYVGSWVSVYGILWDEDGGYSYTDKAIHSTRAEEGTVISAALDRPEGMPKWYVEVTTPPGSAGCLTLTYNGITGTPAKEWIIMDSQYSIFNDEGEEIYYDKPVIYLYPEKETEVSVKLELAGELTCTYPAYENGWRVTAQPDGTLTDEKGQTYNYLYWEASGAGDYDFSQGFCVKGTDTSAFLEEALEKLGLNRREANEFIVYWLPLMEENPYNIISFQHEAYTQKAKLDISPAPDSLIRVFMTWYASDNAVEIPPQKLNAPERTGFTVVEWGGSQLY